MSNVDATAAGTGHRPRRITGAPAAIGDVIGGGRWSVSEVHRGGQAWVLVVDDLHGRNRRALKVSFLGQMAGDAEIVAILGLQPHPHVVTALDVVEINDSHGLVLEYVPDSLAKLLRRERANITERESGASSNRRAGPDPPRVRWLVPRGEILQEVCDGMAWLSERGEFAHFDLKPSNVLIDEAGGAKVADFGLAGRISLRNGRFASAVGGTWAYAAPEVLSMTACDSRADIFSFGILLYETCTGMLPYPFRLSSTGEAQRRQLLDYYDSPGPQRRNEELYYGLPVTEVPVAPADEGIGIVLSSCLQEYPGRRPSSFRELAELLLQYVGLPIVNAKLAPFGEAVRQQRELARCEALIRLTRFDEAVRAVNRLQAAPVIPALSKRTVLAARSALLGAGRTDEASEITPVGTQQGE